MDMLGFFTYYQEMVGISSWKVTVTVMVRVTVRVRANVMVGIKVRV